MLRLKKLLLPIDYSARCLGAADAVRVLATRSPVEVSVLHVTDERAQRRADQKVISAFSERLAGFDVRFCELSRVTPRSVSSSIPDPTERI